MSKITTAIGQATMDRAVTIQARKTWAEKLEFLLDEEARASDPTIRFKLGKEIEQCRERLGS